MKHLKCTKEELALLSTMLRFMLKSYFNEEITNHNIGRVFIRTLARALEIDNPFYKTIYEKKRYLNKFKELNDITLKVLEQYNSVPRGVSTQITNNYKICQTFNLVLEASYEDLPLYVNEPMDILVKTYYKWRLTIKK